MSGNARTRRKARRARERQMFRGLDMGILDSWTVSIWPDMDPDTIIKDLIRTVEEFRRKYPPTPEERAHAEWKKCHFGYPGNLRPRDFAKSPAAWEWLGWGR